MLTYKTGKRPNKQMPATPSSKNDKATLRLEELQGSPVGQRTQSTRITTPTQGLARHTSYPLVSHVCFSIKQLEPKKLSSSKQTIYLLFKYISHFTPLQG
jgi:hypothetical protein